MSAAKQPPELPTEQRGTHCVQRLVRRWEIASARYNWDCNMRHARLGDNKRHKLKAQAEAAFEAMIEAVKRTFPPNNQAEP